MGWNKKLVLGFWVVFLPYWLCAQVGGIHTFKFLSLVPNGRIGALGGSHIAVKDDDSGLAFANPSLLNETMSGDLSFNYTPYFADIRYGYASYAHNVERLGTTFQGGVQFIQYGTFEQTDVTGTVLGEFKAAEYALTVGAGRQITEKFSAGVNIKFVTSSLESYRASGLASDWGLTYVDTANLFTAALVFQNMGFQVGKYSDLSGREPLPLNIQLGISQRLRHLPFRISFTLHDLQRWNIRYDDPNSEEPTLLFGEDTPTESKLSIALDNFFRHTLVGGEFLIGKKEIVRLRMGYNHQRHQELKMNTLRSFGGFSLGAGIKIKNFRLDVGHGWYHIAGGTNHISLSTDLSAF
jgi:hypothetical protein